MNIPNGLTLVISNLRSHNIPLGNAVLEIEEKQHIHFKTVRELKKAVQLERKQEIRIHTAIPSDVLELLNLPEEELEKPVHPDAPSGLFYRDEFKRYEQTIDGKVAGKADLGRVTSLETQVESNAALLAQTAKFEAQADFVNLIRDRSHYKRLRIRKNPNDSSLIDVVLDDGNKHITYDFKKNTNDDFIMLRTGYLANMQMVLFDKKNYDSTTGTWVTSSAPSYYTTQVGATFTGIVKGTEIKFGYPSDNRGGIWEFVVDNDSANPITISTFSSSFTAYTEKVIKSGLSDTTHTVVGTYKGDDPSNPPSGGTSRGWVYYNNNAANFPTRWTFTGHKNEVVNSYTNGTMLLGYGSNKEFAFQITKDGQTQWFPEHNSVGTAFKIEDPKYLIDSKQLNLNNLIQGEFYEGNSFQLVQYINCKIPNLTGTQARATIVHTIGLDGVVSVSGEIEFLQDCTVQGYGLMFPIVANSLNEFISGIGNNKVSKSDDTWAHFSEETDRVFSFAGIDSRNPDYISAITLDYPFKSLRVGKNGRNDIDKIWGLWQRSTYPKLYPIVYSNHTVQSGERYNWNGRFAIGNIKNVYNFVK